MWPRFGSALVADRTETSCSLQRQQLSARHSQPGRDAWYFCALQSSRHAPSHAPVLLRSGTQLAPILAITYRDSHADGRWQRGSRQKVLGNRLQFCPAEVRWLCPQVRGNRQPCCAKIKHDPKLGLVLISIHIDFSSFYFLIYWLSRECPVRMPLPISKPAENAELSPKRGFKPGCGAEKWKH